MCHRAQKKIRLSFPTGNEAQNLFVSRAILRKSRDVEGPSVLSLDDWTPRFEETEVRVTRPEAGGDEIGGNDENSSKNGRGMESHGC